MSNGGRVIEIHKDCREGTCSCTNPIGDFDSNFKPCRVGHFLFSGECNLPASYVDTIWDGLCDGFKIVDEDCVCRYECENYLSITDGRFKEEMSELLKSEILEGKVAVVSDKPTCIHSMGAVEKSDGRLRPITDCSRPDRESINNFMTTTCHDFRYNSVNDVTRVLDKGDFMSVVDVASAYRSVPIYPQHSSFQGMKWDFDDGRGELYLQENRLSFGLKCAPFIFSLLSEMVVGMVKSRGVSRIVNYLDDFIVVSDSFENCQRDQKVLLDVLRQVGFSISWKKVSSPGTKRVFLGICIDSEAMTLTLPHEKIDKLVSIIVELETSGKASKRQLESLGGLVSHFSSVIRGGRTFCRRIYDLANRVRGTKGILLDDHILLDLSWWKNLCHSFNGTANIIGKECSTSLIKDASTTGFGGWSEGDWFLGCWDGKVPLIFEGSDHVIPPPQNGDLFSPNINVYELFAVLVAIRRWGPQLRDTAIQIVTDNNQVRFMINTGRSSNKCCMSWLREYFGYVSFSTWRSSRPTSDQRIMFSQMHCLE